MDLINVPWWNDDTTTERDRIRQAYQIKVEEENKRKCLIQKKT